MTAEQIAELQQRIRSQQQKTQALRPSEPEFAVLMEGQLVILRVLKALIEDQ